MRAVKPQRLGLLSRPYTYAGEHWLGVSVLAGFHLDRPEELMLETAMWAFASGRLGASVPLDIGVPKRGAEVLVTGAAHPPGGRATECPVTVRVGAIERTLYVIGDRRWSDDGRMTAPRPFERMPLSWEVAFGGDGFAPNPLGKGYAPEPSWSGPLPNVEEPGALVRAPSDRPAPACFGPLDPLWPARADKAGTYDARWLAEDYPGFARDVDWSYFNLASPAQRQAEPFEGGERIELVHLHPERPRIAARAPSHRARCLVRRRSAGPGDAPFEDVPMQATTLWLFPEDLTGIWIHHGSVRVAEDDASDLDAIVIGADPYGGPRSVEHFVGVFAARTQRDDPAAAMRAVRDDAPLLPAPPTSTFGAELEETAALLQPKGHRAKRQWRRLRGELAAARAELAALGLDTSDYEDLPEDPPGPPGPAQMEELAAQQRALAETGEARRAAELEAGAEELREAYAEAGLDADDLDDAEARAVTGPPTFSAADSRAELRAVRDEAGSAPELSFLDEMADGPEFVSHLERAERQTRDAYRTGAHLQRPIPERLLRRAEARDALTRRLAAGAPLAEIDLSGADLSGLDLAGADLRGAWLESARLDGADLRGARLEGAVLARAQGRGARLDGASLEGANLGGAELVACSLARVDLRDAVLVGIRLVDTSLAGARLGPVRPRDAELVDCDLSEADLRGSFLVDCALTRVRLVGADLTEAQLVRLDLRGSDLRDVRFDRGVAAGVRLAGVSLDGASIARSVFVEGTTLRGSSLRGATASGALLRDVDLGGAILEEASLEGADVSGADLRAACLDGASARGLRAIRARLEGATLRGADLRDALLTKADLRGADLGGACLYGADLALVRGDDGTRVDGVHAAGARTVPVRRESALPELAHA